MSAPLNFVSWVQPFTAGALPRDDAGEHPTAPGNPMVSNPRVQVVLTSNLGYQQSISAPQDGARLLGPGDVFAIDPAQIVRRYPAPNTAGTNTTHLAFIDFAATDFPWRFSPATADPTATPPDGPNRLRPWLVLLAVTADNQVSTDDGPPRIIVPAHQLPDLDQSWAWAHAQLDDPTDSSTGRSRLLCPCQLSSGVAMRAVLVPAFVPVLDTAADGTSRITSYAPAWKHPATDPVPLPVYDSWTFTTGDDLDFETLARRIAPLPPNAIKQLGALTVGVDDQVPSGVLGVETALGPITPPPGDPTQQAVLAGCTQALIQRINGDVTSGELCPPIRGRYHAQRSLLDPTASTWLDMANRDPRRRLAAGRGADWVNANQEDLMAQAWEQAGQVREAARQLRSARAGLTITDSLHRRHLLPLSVDETVRVKAPAAGQLQAAAGTTTHGARPLADVITASAAPRGTGGTQFGRLTRTLATLKVNTAASPTGGTLTSKAMAGVLVGMPGVHTVSSTQPATPVAPDVVGAVPWGLQILNGPNRATQTTNYLTERFELVGDVQVALEGLPVGTTSGITPTMITAGGVDQQPMAASSFAAHGFPGGRVGMTALYVTNAATTGVWGSTPSPNNAVAQRISARLTTSNGSSPVRTIPAGTIAIRPAVTSLVDGQLVSDMQLALPTPQVGAALGLALLERDPNWMVAGAKDFPDDTATLLQPNAEVIEAIFLGANYAMLDEYLWRGFPTDRRGTPIRRFWPVADPSVPGDDIPPIAQWDKQSPLGAHLAAAASADLTVLMLRTELFERYPDMVIGAVPATTTTGGQVPTPDVTKPMTGPSFPMIAVDSRTRIIGFPIAHASLLSAPGWYFVLIEPPVGIRFGFEADVWPGGSDPFLNNPFGEHFATSAALAVQAFQPPVRVFLHSARMVR